MKLRVTFLMILAMSTGLFAQDMNVHFVFLATTALPKVLVKGCGKNYILDFKHPLFSLNVDACVNENGSADFTVLGVDSINDISSVVGKIKLVNYFDGQMHRWYMVTTAGDTNVIASSNTNFSYRFNKGEKNTLTQLPLLTDSLNFRFSG